MIFLGSAFFSGNQCGDISAVNSSKINSLTLQNGIYDDLYVSKDAPLNLDNIKLEWDFDTVFYAMFKNDLLAGNIGFAIDTITSIRIKKREKGTFVWTPIIDVPIKSIEDLKFIRSYPYCKGNTTYEFSMSPILNGSIEGNLNIMECESIFNGAYIIEPEAALHMFLNYQMSQQRERSGTVVQTLGRRKPFYISNGQYNYDSGSINVTFIQMDDQCEFDLKNGAKYRQYVDDVLSDNLPKILKLDDGRMWIIGITDVISQSDSATQVPSHSINWTEIADCDDAYDMYVNGFNDTFVEV
jgi:hypothetical protein